MKTNALLICAAVVALSACAGSPGYIAASDAGDYGYSEQILGENQYRITFNGRRMLRDERLADYVLRRAAEITRAEGYDWFVIANPEAPVAAADGTDGVRVIPASGSGSVLGHNGLRDEMQQRSGALGADLYDKQPQRPRMSIMIEITLGEGLPPAGKPGFYAKDVLEIPDTI